MKVTVIRQYSVFMPNKPGALARLAQAFSDSGINIIGITSEVRDDSALVRIALAGESEHSGVLSKAGYASVEGRLLSVEVDDRPGQLADITKRLGSGGVNITTVYGTAIGDGRSRLLFAVDDTDRAVELLQSDD